MVRKNPLFIGIAILLFTIAVSSLMLSKLPEFIERSGNPDISITGDNLYNWGSQGSGDGQFGLGGPRGIAVESGYVYVVDSALDRIQLFTESGQYVLKWGSRGIGDGNFQDPSGIALDDLGRVYVADVNNNRIQVFNQQGQFLFKWGSYGVGDGQMGFPEGIAVNASGVIYVTDSLYHRVQVFTSTGQFLFKWGRNGGGGSSGNGPGEFNSPYGIAINNSGYVFVSDYNNYRVQVFYPNGTFLNTWGTHGQGDGEFNSALYLDIDEQGYIYVAEWESKRVQVFTPTGDFVTKWTIPHALSIGVSPQGRVFVTDNANQLVRVFESMPTDYYVTSGIYNENFSTKYYSDLFMTDAAGWGSGQVYSCPTNPTLVGSTDLKRFPDSPASVIAGVGIKGTLAYATSKSSTVLYTVNIANPNNPTQVGAQNVFIGSGFLDDVFISGTYTYITYHRDGGSFFGYGLLIYNGGSQICNFWNMGQMTGSGGLDGEIFVEGSRLYLAAGHVLWILDITNPANPFIIGSYTVGSGNNDNGFIKDIYIHNDVAYLVSSLFYWPANLFILNVSNPSSPQLLKLLSATEPFRGVAVSGNILAAGGGNGGLLLYDVTNASDPVFLKGCSGNAQKVRISGGLAYFTSEGGYLNVANISNPSEAETIRSAYIGDFGYFRFDISGNYAYLGGNNLKACDTQIWKPSSVVQSATLFSGSSYEKLNKATLTCTEEIQPGTSVIYYLSPDDGVHWEQVTPTVEHLFTNAGNQLKWKAVLSTTNASVPKITELNISFSTVLYPPSLISPSNGISTNNTRPEFSWNVIPEATNYWIQLDTASTFDSLNLLNITGSTSTYTPTEALSDGTWYWRVAANNTEKEWGPFSAYRTMTVDTFPPESPAPISPENNSYGVSSMPTFEWESVIDADQYTLQLDTLASFTSGNLRSIGGVFGSNYVPSSSLMDGTWFWRVRAIDAASNEGPFSGISNLTIDTIKPVIDVPEEIVFVEGTKNHVITWSPSDLHPFSYSITQNSKLIASGIWNGGQIGISIADLSPGQYQFNCTVLDLAGNTKSSMVSVEVQELHPNPLEWVLISTSIGVGGVCGIFVLHKKGVWRKIRRKLEELTQH